MTAYPETLRDIPDADLAELVAERECLEVASSFCAGRGVSRMFSPPGW